MTKNKIDKMINTCNDDVNKLKEIEIMLVDTLKKEIIDCGIFTSNILKWGFIELSPEHISVLKWRSKSIITAAKKINSTVAGIIKIRNIIGEPLTDEFLGINLNGDIIRGEDNIVKKVNVNISKIEADVYEIAYITRMLD